MLYIKSIKRKTYKNKYNQIYHDKDNILSKDKMLFGFTDISFKLKLISNKPLSYQILILRIFIKK
ncbi:hypothetical protein BBU72A_0776 [Borreliella burgdorferi 72a]|nr:hypothetical protein BBU72A_0776 [Borreliella burgdorferi 72a]